MSVGTPQDVMLHVQLRLLQQLRHLTIACDPALSDEDMMRSAVTRNTQKHCVVVVLEVLLQRLQYWRVQQSFQELENCDAQIGRWSPKSLLIPLV